MIKPTSEYLLRYAYFASIKVAPIVKETIKNYICQKRMFVICYGRSVDIFCIQGRDANLFNIINKRRFTDDVLLVTAREVIKIEKRNWKLVCSIIAPQRQGLRDDRILRDKQPEHAKMFETGSTCDRYKKPSKRGFYRTNYANEVQYYTRNERNKIGY